MWQRLNSFECFPWLFLRLLVSNPLSTYLRFSAHFRFLSSCQYFSLHILYSFLLPLYSSLLLFTPLYSFLYSSLLFSLLLSTLFSAPLYFSQVFSTHFLLFSTFLYTFSTPLYFFLLFSTFLYTFLFHSTPLYSSLLLSTPLYSSLLLFTPLYFYLPFYILYSSLIITKLHGSSADYALFPNFSVFYPTTINLKENKNVEKKIKSDLWRSKTLFLAPIQNFSMSCELEMRE